MGKTPKDIRSNRSGKPLKDSLNFARTIQLGKDIQVMNKLNAYNFRTFWSHDDEEYVGVCEQFPSLSVLYKSEEMALAEIKKLVEECLTDMIECDETLP